MDGIKIFKSKDKRDTNHIKSKKCLEMNFSIWLKMFISDLACIKHVFKDLSKEI